MPNVCVGIFDPLLVTVLSLGFVVDVALLVVFMVEDHSDGLSGVIVYCPGYVDTSSLLDFILVVSDYVLCVAHL